MATTKNFSCHCLDTSCILRTDILLCQIDFIAQNRTFNRINLLCLCVGVGGGSEEKIEGEQCVDAFHKHAMKLSILINDGGVTQLMMCIPEMT